jgi:hypothetical protein
VFVLNDITQNQVLTHRTTKLVVRQGFFVPYCSFDKLVLSTSCIKYRVVNNRTAAVPPLTPSQRERPTCKTKLDGAVKDNGPRHINSFPKANARKIAGRWPEINPAQLPALVCTLTASLPPSTGSWMVSHLVTVKVNRTCDARLHKTHRLLFPLELRAQLILHASICYVLISASGSDAPWPKLWRNFFGSLKSITKAGYSLTILFTLLSYGVM